MQGKFSIVILISKFWRRVIHSTKTMWHEEWCRLSHRASALCSWLRMRRQRILSLSIVIAWHVTVLLISLHATKSPTNLVYNHRVRADLPFFARHSTKLSVVIFTSCWQRRWSASTHRYGQQRGISGPRC